MTQEINPAGTLISVNQVASIFLGTFIHFFIKYLTDLIGASTSVARAAAIVLLSLGVLIIYPVVKKEFKEGTAKQMGGSRGNSSVEQRYPGEYYSASSRNESLIGGYIAGV